MIGKFKRDVVYLKDSENWENPDLVFLMLCFTMFFFNKLAPLFLVLFIVSSLFYKTRFQFNWKDVLSVKSPFLWMSLFFIMHLVGLLWTENSSFAQMDIGMKISFILFPLLAIFIKTKVKLEKFIEVFVFGLTLTVFILVANAIFKSVYNLEDNHWAYFFESEFSAFMHRSYFATYAAMGAVFAMVSGLKTTSDLKMKYFFSAFVLSVATILTISKAGIIILTLSLFVLGIHYLIRKGKLRLLITGTVLVSIALVIFFQFDNRITSRFKMIQIVNQDVQLYNNMSSESNEARLIMWNTSWNIIKENPILGVGTGDVKDELIAKNMEYGNIKVAMKKLNSHNQFLNTWVQVGVFGFLTIVFTFVTFFIQAYRRKNPYLFYFGFIIFASLFAESFFESQAGILPFCFVAFALLTCEKVEDK